jgi:hypothetical protein
MLRLTTANSNNIFFPSLFSSVSPQKIKKDVWDFGDKISIGNKISNTIDTWEAIDRNSFYYNDAIVYIDVLTKCEENGCGPSEKHSYECLLYDAGNLQLEVRDSITTLLVSLNNAEDVEKIYENLNYFLSDVNFNENKYSWIGNTDENKFNRELYISKKANDKKKKEALSKIPRIPLVTAVVNDKRKRG